MSTATVEGLKAELVAENTEFRELLREHKRCDNRLTEILSLSHPSAAELDEAASLKKKKLVLKDRMDEMAHLWKTSHTSH